jgi:hypothetical protein
LEFIQLLLGEHEPSPFIPMFTLDFQDEQSGLLTRIAAEDDSSRAWTKS